jgi:hypothetical protein
MSRIRPEELEGWREALYLGERLDVGVTRRLVAEVEQLRIELARARIDFAKKAAAALEKRLADVAAFNHGGCERCRDAEARAFLARLKKIGTPEKL